MPQQSYIMLNECFHYLTAQVKTDFSKNPSITRWYEGYVDKLVLAIVVQTPVRGTPVEIFSYVLESIL